MLYPIHIAEYGRNDSVIMLNRAVNALSIANLAGVRMLMIKAE